MKFPMVRWNVAAGILALVTTACAGGQELPETPPGEPSHSATYLETTAGRRVELAAREWRTDDGMYLESESSAGDRHVVIVNERLETQAWGYTGPNSTTLAVRRGDTVAVSGRLGGDAVGGTVEMGDAPWIQSIERSLRAFVLDGKPGDRRRFSVVQPDNLSARTLEARIMEDEEVVILGRPIAARRIRISLPGIGALFWRSHYWYRLSDGLFVQSKVTRGPPGTPETLVILTGDSGPAP